MHGAGEGVIFDLDTNASRRTQDVKIRSAWPLRGALILVCYGRAGSCQTVDTRDGGLRKAFSGIVPSFRCADAVPEAAALAFKGQLVVVTLSEDGTPRGHAFLKDRSS